MTEQEAQALARRWIRIWMPDRANSLPPRGDNHPRNSEDFQGVFWDFEFTDWRSIRLTARVAFDALLMVDESYDGPHYAFWLVGYGDATGKIQCEMGGTQPGQVAIQNYDSKDQSFAIKWLPFFRRGCWLSGCPLEASAHEKAEWIQGFSPEELQAWNLNF